MERNEANNETTAPSLLGEVFAMTSGNSSVGPAQQAETMQKFHARLASREFAAQMTGIFFDAKRDALAGSK